MVTKFELRRSAFIAFVLMTVILIIAWGIWSTAAQLGIIERGGLMYYLLVSVQLALISLAFLFSMVFFGCIVEYQGKQPGVITLGFAYIPPILYMYAIGMLMRFIYIFMVISMLLILYVLYSE